jgi:hypothetical protein
MKLSLLLTLAGFPLGALASDFAVAVADQGRP